MLIISSRRQVRQKGSSPAAEDGSNVFLCAAPPPPYDTPTLTAGAQLTVRYIKVGTRVGSA
jgi:hypothetical protein